MIANLRNAYGWLVNPYGLLDKRLRRDGLTFASACPCWAMCW